MHRKTFIAKFTEVQRTVEQMWSRVAVGRAPL
jgi:hypothetical protein